MVVKTLVKWQLIEGFEREHENEFKEFLKIRYFIINILTILLIQKAFMLLLVLTVYI